MAVALHSGTRPTRGAWTPGPASSPGASRTEHRQLRHDSCGPRSGHPGDRARPSGCPMDLDVQLDSSLRLLDVRMWFRQLVLFPMGATVEQPVTRSGTGTSTRSRTRSPGPAIQSTARLSLLVTGGQVQMRTVISHNPRPRAQARPQGNRRV